MNLIERRDRTAKVIDRFRDKPFSWSGAGNCIHLAREQLAAMGHSVPPVPRFRTPLGARRALAKRGFDTLEALIDDVLPTRRIPPAAMLLGDVCLLPGEPFDALAVYVGENMIAAWHGNDPEPMRNIVVTGADVTAAWRTGI